MEDLECNVDDVDEQDEVASLPEECIRHERDDRKLKSLPVFVILATLVNCKNIPSVTLFSFFISVFFHQGRFISTVLYSWSTTRAFRSTALSLRPLQVGISTQ